MPVGTNKISQPGLPIAVVGAGLPQLVGNAGRSKSYAERLFDYPNIGPLHQEDAVKALQEPVKQESAEFTDEALEEIIRVTQGYPYFLQEWGYQCWNLAQASPISKTIADLATRKSIERLDANFFRVRFDRLTPRERTYLRALAELGANPQRSGEIASMLGVKSESVAPIRSSLIRKGMIYSPAHGDTAFTVPLFDEFMVRTMPDWRVRE